MTTDISNSNRISADRLIELNDKQPGEIPPLDSQTSAEKTSTFSVALISALPPSPTRENDKSPRVSSESKITPSVTCDHQTLSENIRFEIERGINSPVNPVTSGQNPQTPPQVKKHSHDEKKRGPFQSPDVNVKVRKKAHAAHTASSTILSNEIRKKTESALASSQQHASN